MVAWTSSSCEAFHRWTQPVLNIGKDFRWDKHASKRFKEYFPHVLFLGNLYLFSVLIYKQYFYNPKTSRQPSPPVIRQMARLWNLGWSVFSLMGCIGTSYLLSHISEIEKLVFKPDSSNHLEWVMCGGPGFWLFMYCWTKPLELIDTLLLMSSGRDVRLVHWSHHNITMIFTWYAAKNYLKPAVVFACLNFGVHAVMYLYYFMVSFQSLRKGLRRYAFIVTWIQMIQFVVCLTSMALYYEFYTRSDLVVSGAMYSYYLVLFWQLYRERFQKQPPVLEETANKLA